MIKANLNAQAASHTVDGCRQQSCEVARLRGCEVGEGARQPEGPHDTGVFMLVNLGLMAGCWQAVSCMLDVELLDGSSLGR